MSEFIDDIPVVEPTDVSGDLLEIPPTSTDPVLSERRHSVNRGITWVDPSNAPGGVIPFERVARQVESERDRQRAQRAGEAGLRRFV